MRKVLAAALLLALAACGGGGGGGSGAGGSSGSGSGGGSGSAPPSQPVAPTASEASRFLTQATFGPTTSSISAVRSAGYGGWITQQLSASSPSTHLSYLDARLTALQASNPQATLNPNHFYESWWRQAVTGPDELRQRVAFALSQIFVISLVDPNVDVRGAGAYYDLLSRNAFGNYRTLLEEVSLNPMMGRYLTFLANQKEDTAGTRTPDENYAREVMQLMTIGLWELNPDGTQRLNAQGQPIATYTPADIAGLAKVFTGISWYHPTPTNTTFFGANRDPNREVRAMIFYPQYHSTSEKVFLGTTIPASTTVDMAGDLRIALDRLFNHANVGPFIAQRLIQQLVTSNPSPAYVGRVAAVFNNNGSNVRGDLGAVIRAVLTDAEAREAATAAGASFGKLREPVVRVTNWARAFGATSTSGNWLITSTSANTSLGQTPLASPSVFNFWRPGFVPPGTTQLGSRGLLAPEFQIVDEVTVAGYVNTINNTINAGIGSSNDVRAVYTAELALADNADQLVDHVALLLAPDQMSATLRTRVLAGVNAIAIPPAGSTQTQIDTARLNRVKSAILFVMASPDYLAQR
ncbi:MAG: DUF1800 domain-containing protein [Hyphomonadaceae bacterium]|nr:DUF1800 domain-containing protein [Hyphomonadaceae bacterium]